MIDPSRRLVPATRPEDHPIHHAAETGRVARVRAFLDQQPSLVHDINRGGGHPLHRAVIGGSVDVVTLLLDRGADVHAIHGAGVGSFAGYAPQDKQPIDLAIWGGPRVAPRSRWRCYVHGLTRLVWRRWRSNRATWPGAGNVRLARLLIERGATYDLAIASALNDLAAVRSMLDADPSRIAEQRPDDRRPLSAAAEFGHLDIVRLLLERGADPTWPDADASERGAALHAAAGRGDREMVELLLEHGADPNGFVNASGNAVCAARTPAIRRLLEAHGGFLDPYDLVWKGEDDEVMRIVSERPETALAGCGGVFTAVVTCGRRRLMHRLLAAGFKVPPKAGGCHSYFLERPDMLRELLTRGGLDPNYPTKDGVTLLHELCHKDIRGRTMRHRTKCGEILLKFGADPSPKDKHSETPLMWAAKYDLKDIADFLKARGAT
jgi:ankyrin repeat protein